MAVESPPDLFPYELPKLDLLRQCVHCGLCLPTCPTYSILGDEADSPRGRIFQMIALVDGHIQPEGDFEEHIYCCLDCRACETACPSGVKFGELVEAARGQIESRRRRPLGERLLRRLIFAGLFPHPSRLAAAVGLARLYQRSRLRSLLRATGLLKLLPRRLEEMEALMPDLPGPLVTPPMPEITPAIGERRYRVGMVSGCVQSQVFAGINADTACVLAENGCEVWAPPQQRCCGALHVHAGERALAVELARRNIAAFSGRQLDAIIINAAGCGAALKEYHLLLEHDPQWSERAAEFSHKVKDVSEFLAEIGIKPPPGRLPEKVAYHEACHLAHGQKVRQQPRQLLRAIPGLELVEIKESDWCCGSAGIYNVTQPELAGKLLQRKMENLIRSGAQTVAVGNPGCILQIASGVRAGGLSMRVVHPVELLARAYRGD